MKHSGKGLMMLAAMMAATATDKNLFAAPYYNSEPPYKENNSPEAKGLHEYECNGHFFYAHNDKEALKRAKKKGYWIENTEIKQIN